MINKVKIDNTVRSIEGCKNRMCVTDSIEELERMYMFATLYLVDLYTQNRSRIFDERSEN